MGEKEMTIFGRVRDVGDAGNDGNASRMMTAGLNYSRPIKAEMCIRRRSIGQGWRIGYGQIIVRTNTRCSQELGVVGSWYLVRGIYIAVFLLFF